MCLIVVGGALPYSIPLYLLVETGVEDIDFTAPSFPTIKIVDRYTEAPVIFFMSSKSATPTPDTSENPDLLIKRLNSTFAKWVSEQMNSESGSLADWSVACLEYSCHVENIRSAFKVEDPRVFTPSLNQVEEDKELETKSSRMKIKPRKRIPQKGSKSTNTKKANKK